MKNLSTRSRLILLVVVSALPALVLTAYSAFEERAAARDNARADLVRLTQLAAREQEQIIEGVRQSMVASAQVLGDLQGRRAACDRYLAGLLEQNRNRYHSMGLYDATGDLICNAAPWTGRISAADRGYFRRAKDTGAFAIGEFQTGRVTGREAVNFGYPVRNAAGKITAIAFICFDLDTFNRVAATTPLPREGNITVLDRNGVVIGRYPETAAVKTGEKLQNARVLQAVFSARSGVFEAARLDGAERLYVYEGVARDSNGATPMRVLVSLPLDLIFAEANRTLVRALAGIGAATLLLLLGAWFGTEFFVHRSIRTLLATARRVHAGDLSARTGMRQGNDELNQVGRAFDEMAEALQQREAELKRVMQGLQEQAVTDSLTGLYNLRYLRELLPRELARARRNNGAVAAIMVDIDHFKRINDSFGHDAGNLVLRELAALFRRSLRASDVACRYGGEEFALILPDAPVEGAMHKAEAIRLAVKALLLEYQGRPLGPITASLGVAVFPLHAAEANALLVRADEALYRAKGEGRDRVVVSEIPAAEPGPGRSA